MCAFPACQKLPEADLVGGKPMKQVIGAEIDPSLPGLEIDGILFALKSDLKKHRQKYHKNNTRYHCTVLKGVSIINGVCKYKMHN